MIIPPQDLGSLALATPVSGDLRRKRLRQLVPSTRPQQLSLSHLTLWYWGWREATFNTDLRVLAAVDISPLDLCKTFRDDQGKDTASSLEDTKAENHLLFPSSMKWE